MIWNICFPLSLIVLVVGAVIAMQLFRNKRMQNNDTLGFFTLAISTFVALTVMYYALEYSQLYCEEQFGWITAIFVAVRDTIGTFVVDGDFSFYAENMQGMIPWIVPVCSVAMALMIIAAPVFTFGFLLSFFKNLSSMIRFSLKKKANVYVFSELNDKSLVLATDLKKNNEHRVIVFCDVFENDEERFGEMLSEAKKIRAIFFQKDILDIDFKKHIKRGSVYFMIMGEDDAENIKQSLVLIREYGDCANANLYLLSESVTSELLLLCGKKHRMKIRNVNESVALIQRTLYDDPISIFQNTQEVTPEGDKVISAVVVGLGGYGVEMLKTLAWYGQMDGYRLQIHAFDKDEKAEQRMQYLCPEILSKEYSGTFVPGEAFYQVEVHSGVEVGTMDFANHINAIKNASFVMVCLGGDDLNIETAIGLRMLYERMGIHPAIYAVVHNDALSEALADATNYKNQSYDIRMIGGIEKLYSEKVLMDVKLEKEALAIHCAYDPAETFFIYEYSRQSSTASALHNRARAELKIHGAHLPAAERTKEQEHALMVLEHRRWNAYMRSIGYVYSGSDDASTRNDLAKMHHNLACYEKLNQADKDKDRRVSSV